MSKLFSVIEPSPSPPPLVYKYNPDTKLGIELPTSAWLVILSAVGALFVTTLKYGIKCYQEHSSMVGKVEQIQQQTTELLVEEKANFNRLSDSLSKLDTRISVSTESIDGLKKEVTRLEAQVNKITEDLQGQRLKDERLENKINYIETELKQIQETLDQYAHSEQQVERQQHEIERQQKLIENILRQIETLRGCST